jgi:hypothetical protein
VSLRSLIALVLLLGACGPSDPPGPPDTDACSMPEGGTLDALEIGTRDRTFTPFVEGQELPVVYGSQGGAMVPVRLRISGSDLPACLPVTISIMGPMYPFGSSNVPLQTYPEPDGSRTTRAIFVIGSGGGGGLGDYMLTATALGTTSTVRLVVSGAGP